MIQRFHKVKMFIILLLFLFSIPQVALPMEKESKKTTSAETSVESVRTEDRVNQERPVFSVFPRELDFGVISIGEGSRGSVVLKNDGKEALKWSVTGPEGWTLLEDQKISGVLKEDASAHLKIHISSLKKTLSATNATSGAYLVQVGIETDSRMSIYRKSLPSGIHRKVLRLTSNVGETKTVSLRFELTEGEREPLLQVSPQRIDFGQVGSDERVTKKLMVTNRGRDVLRWRAACGVATDQGSPMKNGRYVSFLNESAKGTNVYLPPVYLRDSLDILGKWSEKAGYPVTQSSTHVMKYRFWGTGIGVFFSVEHSGEGIRAHVDEKRLSETECQGNTSEVSECLVADGLPYGQHILVVSGKEGRSLIEGVRIYGAEVKRGPPGWISVFPDSGTTTKETDYVTVAVNAQRLNPGYYGDTIIFTSNGGEKNVEISLEVTGDNKYRVVDVYRYVSGSDYLFTTNPEADEVILRGKGYKKQGIAFRLFVAGTPGTTPFHRWYHPGLKRHFYSHDIKGEGKSLKNYVYKGSIGNIATSRLTNTRELYRWFNPSVGSYFYTTDPRGEDSLKKGYRFDGIAGYVR